MRSRPSCERGGDVSFLYTIPTFQNPSGRTLGEERRRRIAELCRKHGVDVLEDDPYGLVRYEGAAPPALHALEGGERVTFTSSFSKTVAPGLRVGWFVVPEALRSRVRRARRLDVHLAAAPAPGDRPRALRARRVRAQPRADPWDPAGPARRDARRARRRAGGAGDLEPPRGRILPVGRLRRRDRRGGPARSGDGGGRHLRPRGGLLPRGEGGASSARLAFSYEAPERIAEGVRILAGLL